MASHGELHLFGLSEIRRKFLLEYSPRFILLYASGSFMELHLDEYLRRVVSGLSSFAGAVALHPEFVPIVSPAAKAVPIGLIVTE